MNATDAIEFLLAGASAIEVGTANFIDPQISEKIVDGIDEYLEKKSYLVGKRVDRRTYSISCLLTDK